MVGEVLDKTGSGALQRFLALLVKMGRALFLEEGRFACVARWHGLSKLVRSMNLEVCLLRHLIRKDRLKGEHQGNLVGGYLINEGPFEKGGPCDECLVDENET